jgi:hypothetical protein
MHVSARRITDLVDSFEYVFTTRYSADIYQLLQYSFVCSSMLLTIGLYVYSGD